MFTHLDVRRAALQPTHTAPAGVQWQGPRGALVGRRVLGGDGPEAHPHPQGLGHLLDYGGGSVQLGLGYQAGREVEGQD